MPYDINQFSPGYGGTINSSGNVVNIADTLDESTGQFKPPAMKQLTLQSGATAIGNGTPADISGYATLIIQVTISAVATVAFEGSLDGTNYFSISTNSPNATGASQNTTNAAGTSSWRFNIAGFKFFRARISSFGSGTVDVIGYASTAPFSPQYLTTQAGSSDTNSATNILQAVGAYNLLYDGTNWVRQRSVISTADGGSGSGLSSTALMGFNGSTWDRVKSVNTGQLRTTLYSSTGAELTLLTASTVSDNSSLSTQNGIIVSNLNLGYNGSGHDRVRVGKTYKWNEFLGLTAGSTFTVWTPTSTKKIRIMGLSVSVSGASALNVRVGTAGSGTRIATLRFAGAGNYYLDFGNGYLATNATTDVLEINNPASSPTSATVDVHVTAYGTEE